MRGRSGFVVIVKHRIAMRLRGVIVWCFVPVRAITAGLCCLSPPPPLSEKIFPPPQNQVQFQLLFGAIFLRGLAQLKGGGEDDPYRADASGSSTATATASAGGAGQRDPTMPSVAGGASAHGSVDGGRVFRNRELEVGRLTS